jgi:hypothetical protein
MNSYSHFSVRFFLFAYPESAFNNRQLCVQSLTTSLPIQYWITSKNTQGSGFFLNADNASFLVTALHVLFKQDTIIQPRLVNFNQV